MIDNLELSILAHTHKPFSFLRSVPKAAGIIGNVVGRSGPASATALIDFLKLRRAGHQLGSET